MTTETVTPNARDFDLYVAVAVGGVIGALLRHLVSDLVPATVGGWPWATFLVNLSGALVLGLIARLSLSRRMRPFVITGVLGGYTTFSSYMVEAHGLVQVGKTGLALGYLFSSVIFGAAAVAVGLLVSTHAINLVTPEVREFEDEV